MAADCHADASDRCAAAEVLGQLGYPRGPRLLGVMAADASADRSDRCGSGATTARYPPCQPGLCSAAEQFWRSPAM
jgi:hypothetical protein